MSNITGIETIIYGVEDLELCTRYFCDFGLPLISSTDQESVFELAEGSTVIVRTLENAVVEGQKLVGFGVQQVIWGVADQKSFDRAVAKLCAATEVSIDTETQTAYFFDVDGIASGIRIYDKKVVPGAPAQVNSLGSINRLNAMRKWYRKATPKTIQHVVFQTPDPDASFKWYQEFLDFRLSDIQEGFGIFARAPKAFDHHNIYWLKADLKFPGLDGKTRFNHTNFGVEDLDELMAGANYMERRGWQKSTWGLGRHRIASALFFYLPCPAGGEAEYGTDSDMHDDNWIPRRWEARFGTMSFMHNLQPWIFDESAWDYGFVEGYTPPNDIKSKH